MDNISIVKIGGNIINQPEKLTQFLEKFTLRSGKKILVHGGGNIASEISGKLGIEPELRDGRRITTQESLEVVTMVYGGLVNKNIVAQLQHLGCNALGLSGADGNSIQARIRHQHPIDFGLVGDISKVNTELINTLIGAQITPVFCALSHDGEGQILNTNADSIASSLAIALSSQYKTSLSYVFEKQGVLTNISQEDSVLSSISSSEYKTFKEKGMIQGGMLPKLDNGFYALENGVHQVSIGKTLITY